MLWEALQILVLAWAENRKDLEVVWKLLSQVPRSSPGVRAADNERLLTAKTQPITLHASKPGVIYHLDTTLITTNTRTGFDSLVRTPCLFQPKQTSFSA